MLASFQNSAIGIAVERDDGTLKRLRGTPMPPAAYFLGKIGLVLRDQRACRSALLLAVAVLFFGVDLPTDPARWLTFAWVFLLGTAAGTVLGIGVLGVPRSAQQRPPSSRPVVIVLQFVSGRVLRLLGPAGWMQTVGVGLPAEVDGPGHALGVPARRTLVGRGAGGSWEHGRDRAGARRLAGGRAGRCACARSAGPAATPADGTMTVVRRRRGRPPAPVSARPAVGLSAPSLGWHLAFCGAARDRWRPSSSRTTTRRRRRRSRWPAVGVLALAYLLLGLPRRARATTGVGPRRTWSCSSSRSSVLLGREPAAPRSLLFVAYPQIWFYAASYRGRRGAGRSLLTRRRPARGSRCGDGRRPRRRAATSRVSMASRWRSRCVLGLWIAPDHRAERAARRARSMSWSAPGAELAAAPRRRGGRRARADGAARSTTPSRRGSPASSRWPRPRGPARSDRADDARAARPDRGDRPGQPRPRPVRWSRRSPRSRCRAARWPTRCAGWPSGSAPRPACAVDGRERPGPADAGSHATRGRAAAGRAGGAGERPAARRRARGSRCALTADAGPRWLEVVDDGAASTPAPPPASACPACAAGSRSVGRTAGRRPAPGRGTRRAGRACP